MLLRPSTVSSTSGAGIIHRAREHVQSTRKALTKFARPQSFTAPADAEAAAVRAVRNLRYFRTYYAVVQWAILLLVLAPSRPATVFFLMAASKVAAFYLVLLGAFPNSVVLQRLLDRRLVLGLLLFVVVVRLVLTHAVGHLLLSLAMGMPIILCHAVFRSRDDLSLPLSADSGSDSDEDNKPNSIQILHEDKKGNQIGIDNHQLQSSV